MNAPGGRNRPTNRPKPSTLKLLPDDTGRERLWNKHAHHPSDLSCSVPWGVHGAQTAAHISWKESNPEWNPQFGSTEDDDSQELDSFADTSSLNLFTTDSSYCESKRTPSFHIPKVCVERYGAKSQSKGVTGLEPCTSTVQNETKSSNQFLETLASGFSLLELPGIMHPCPDRKPQYSLGVRLPITLVTASPAVRPPPSVDRPPRPARPRNPAGSSLSTTSPSTVEIRPSSEVQQTRSSEFRLPNRNDDGAEDDTAVPKALSNVDNDRITGSEETAKTTGFDREVRPSIRQHKPRVAFVEPTKSNPQRYNRQVSSTGSLLTTNPASPAESSQNSSCDLKLSPSAQFPGWGVITDDDDDEDNDDDDAYDVDENNEGDRSNKRLTKQTLSSDDSKPDNDDAPNDGKVVNKDVNKTNQPIKGKQANVLEERTEPLEVQPTLASNTTEATSVRSSPSRPGKSGARKEVAQSVSNITSEKQRFQIQQECFRRNDSVSQKVHPSMLRQPRKSLALIFSNLSSNLGFTQTHPERTTSLQLGSPRSSGSMESGNRQAKNSFTTSIPLTGDNLAELPGSKLLRAKRGHSTVIQLGKVDSSDLNYANGDVGHRLERGRTITSVNRESEVNVLNTSPLRSANTHDCLTGELSADRSLFVDLLCCTCCTQVDEEEDYSHLIENHKLARFITMAAVLTILGLILAYIIRSALEAPNSIGTNNRAPEGSVGVVEPTTATIAAAIERSKSVGLFSTTAQSHQAVERVRFPTNSR
ncbi:hypothetical protein PHET_05146 [Paragonimus heterotremus]|uniref:Uncharacterized protein n=1 Tax=Paragonimus heterotremus TaxID=100268 RepID=A0A8J4TAY6_9TREM|nr:hypothetical protein PHET_05146 [Paragonimus heterotremus]